MNDLRKQLKQLGRVEGLICPSRDWVRVNRDRLLTQIGNTVAGSSQVSRRAHNRDGLKQSLREIFFVLKGMPLMRAFKPALTALVIATLAMSGWIASVSASFNSVPGDRLWAVKRAAQKTEVAVKSIVASQEEKAELHLRLAKNRAEDIKNAVHKTVTDKAAAALRGASQKESDAVKGKKAKTEKDLAVAARDLTEAVKSASAVANEQVKNAAKDNPKGAVELVKDVTKNNGEIVKTLKATVVEAGSSAPAVTKEVIETVKSVNNSTLSTVEAVVSASTTVSGTEANAVKSLVSEKLAEIAQTAKDIKQNVDTVKDAIKVEAGVSVGAGPGATRNVAPIGPPALAGSSTLNIGIPTAVSATSGLVVEVFNVTTTDRDSASSTAALIDKVKQAEDKTAVIQESVSEVKKKIDAGNLQEAVSQLKGMNETAGTAEKLIAETKVQISDIGVRSSQTGAAPAGGRVKCADGAKC